MKNEMKAVFQLFHRLNSDLYILLGMNSFCTILPALPPGRKEETGTGRTREAASAAAAGIENKTTKAATTTPTGKRALSWYFMNILNRVMDALTNASLPACFRSEFF